MDLLTIVTTRSRKPRSSIPTAREAEVGLQVLAGNKNSEIGEALGISTRTVEVHRGRLMRKLGVKNGVEFTIIVLARKEGVQWLERLTGRKAKSSFSFVGETPSTRTSSKRSTFREE